MFIGDYLQESLSMATVIEQIFEALNSCSRGPIIQKAFNKREKTADFGKASGAQFVEFLSSCKAIAPSELTPMISDAVSMNALLETATNKVKSRSNNALDFEKMGGEIAKLISLDSEQV